MTSVKSSSKKVKHFSSNGKNKISNWQTNKKECLKINQMQLTYMIEFSAHTLRLRFSYNILGRLYLPWVVPT